MIIMFYTDDGDMVGQIHNIGSDEDSIENIVEMLKRFED